MSLDREAHAVGLRHLHRLQAGPTVLVVLARPVARLGGEGDDAVILEAHKLLAVQIDDGDDILDWASVAVVECLGADPAQRPNEPLASVLRWLVAIVARRPGVNHD